MTVTYSINYILIILGGIIMFIGEIILNRRKELNMTQKELSEKLNVTDRTISRWECGVNLPDVEMLKTIAVVLNVDINYFYEDVKTKEINYKEEYDYERIKKYKINFIIPILLLLLSLITIFISKIIYYKITSVVGLFSNTHQMIEYCLESGTFTYIVWLFIITIISIIIMLIALIFHLRNNIHFKYFYLTKVYQNVYLKIYKKLSIIFDIFFAITIFFILL